MYANNIDASGGDAAVNYGTSKWSAPSLKAIITKVDIQSHWIVKILNEYFFQTPQLIRMAEA